MNKPEAVRLIEDGKDSSPERKRELERALDEVDEVLRDLPQLTIGEVLDDVFVGLGYEGLDRSFGVAVFNAGAGGMSLVVATVNVAILSDCKEETVSVHIAPSDPVARKLYEGEGLDAAHFAQLREELKAGRSVELCTWEQVERFEAVRERCSECTVEAKQRAVQEACASQEPPVRRRPTPVPTIRGDL